MANTMTKTRPQTKGAEQVDEVRGEMVAAKEKRGESEELLESVDALIDEIDAVLKTDAVKDGPTTFADFMREGAKMSPQAIGSLATVTGETCALGAAIESMRSHGLL